MFRAPLLIAVSMWMLPGLAFADIHCAGQVRDVLLYANGTVNLRGLWRNDYTYLCSTTGTWGNVPTEVCLSWYATAAKAVADGKELVVWYSGNAHTCANLPTYGASPQPTYVGIRAP